MLLDFEAKFGFQIRLNFPNGFSNLIIGKLSRQCKKLNCVDEIIQKIKGKSNDVEYQNILSLNLLAYLFNCSTNSKGTKLTKVEIADHLLQVKEVSKHFLLALCGELY